MNFMQTHKVDIPDELSMKVSSCGVQMRRNPVHRTPTLEYFDNMRDASLRSTE